MTRDQRSNPTSLHGRPSRNGAACAAIAVGVPELGPNGQTQTVTMPGNPDRLDPCRQPAGQNPPAFNAHSLGGAASGLAQHVFRSPARIQLRSPNAEACAPRRQTKNAVRYIGHFSWDSPSIHKVESAGPGTVGLYRAANPSWDVSPNRRQKSGPSIVTRPQVWRRGFSAGTIRWQIVNNGLDANFIGSEIT
jgi:hypothetical protein